MKTKKALTPEERLIHKKHALHRTLVIDVVWIIVSSLALCVTIGIGLWKGTIDIHNLSHTTPYTIAGVGTSATSLTVGVIKAYLLSARSHYKAREFVVREKRAKTKGKLTPLQKAQIKTLKANFDEELTKIKNG